MKPRGVILVLLTVLIVIWLLLQPPSRDQQLVGTWQRDVDVERQILILEGHRRFLWQFRSRSFWSRLAGVEFDLVGRWSLEGDTLLILCDPGQEVTAVHTFVGLRSEDLSTEFQVLRLTDTELVLQATGAPEELHYTRVVLH